MIPHEHTHTMMCCFCLPQHSLLHYADAFVKFDRVS